MHNSMWITLTDLLVVKAVNYQVTYVLYFRAKFLLARLDTII